MLGEGEWTACESLDSLIEKQETRRGISPAMDLVIDAETLLVRGIEVTDNRQGDAHMLPSLLTQIPIDEPIACVSGDGALRYQGVSSGDCRAAQSGVSRRARMRGRGKAFRWARWLGTRFCGPPSD